MITAHRIGLALALAAVLALGGCAKQQRELVQGWMTSVASAPKAHQPLAHRHAMRVFRHAPRTAQLPVDPDLVTGSVTPIAAPVAPSTVLEACKQRLYLETATSTGELRAAEVACKDIIVNQPFGAGAN